MKFLGFTASPDLMGRRIRLSWGWSLDPLETPGQIPDVLVRRKTRDFAFPPLAAPDPYLMHDSAVFPPAPIPGILAVTDLPDRADAAPGLVAHISAVSVARITPNGPLEVQRRTDAVWRDGAGSAVLVEVAVLDALDLSAGTLYYYELDDGSAPGPETISDYRAIARAGEVWGLNRRLWDLLPETYKGADPTQMPLTATLPGIPEAGRAGGQLKRFIDTFGMGLDTLRNGAEGLRFLRDAETAPPPALAALGRQIGWDVAPALPLEQSRNEVETATRLFGLGGTVQSMRALVTHQTGWRAQAAEKAQSLVRAGVPGQGPLRFLVERAAAPGSFTGGLDASALFGFPPGGAAGGPGVAALLVAGIAEPYPLLPGLELTLSVNGAAPARIVFGPDDFVDTAAAGAAEIAAVIERHFDDVTAYAQAGALVIETLLDGTQARLNVLTARESLLALSEAPAGRISAVADGGRPRLVYATREERPAADGATQVRSRLLVKSWGFGEWRDARALPDWSDDAPEAAAASVAGGLWLALSRDGRRLSLARGQGRAPERALLTTIKAGPFALLAGQRLTLETELGPEIFIVNPGDYVTLAAATSAEIATALNAQLANVVATALPEGALRLATVATGARAWLSVDLANSTIARTLGLSARGLLARGAWDDALDWSTPEAGPRTVGAVRSPAAAAHDGGVVLAWGEHQDGAQRIRAAKWRDRVTVATPNGVAEGGPGGPWTIATMADGLPSNVIRAVAADARGVLAAATDAGLGLRRTGGPWTALTTVGGLPSNDVRALALLPDGTLAVATAAGLAHVSPAGAVATTTAGPGGLLDDDLRGLHATPDGDLLIGSASGLSRRDRFGRWTRWTAAEGLPAGPILAVAQPPGQGGLYAGSALGLSVLLGGVWRGLTVADGLPATDVRGLTVTGDGVLLAATAGGVARLDPGAARWVRTTPVEGLPIADCRDVTVGPGNRVLVGGPGGLAVSMPGGVGPWSLLGVVDGLPAGGSLGLDGPWSAALVLASPDGGAAEPHLAPTADGRLWLAFAARGSAVAAERDSWTLRLRRFDPATALWPAEQALTTALPAGSTDREPVILPLAAGGARLFFPTDRSGGRGLAEVAVDALGVPGAPGLFPLDSAEAWAPAALDRPGGEVWLLHRGDRPFSVSQAATLTPAGGAQQPSLRLADAATLFSPAGLRTPMLAHLPRHVLRHQLGDPMPYTPDEPDKGGGLPGDPVPLNTRRTIVLHVSPAPFSLTPTQERLQRLVQLLNRFKPINVRLRLVLRPDPLVELAYPAGADIGETWGDDVPLIEALGPVVDAMAVNYPGLLVLHAHELVSRSAAFADPTTFRRRTWFPDLI